jgi:UDP-glucose 4-epimerase
MGDPMEKVLITGISGGQGRLVARRLAEEHRVIGVDVVRWRNCPEGIKTFQVDLRKRRFEDIVRRERPTAVVHMAVLRHGQGGALARHDVNVRGTKEMLDHCVKYGVQRLLVLSDSHIYGAFPENPYYMDEDSPVSASRSYPEIRDLVELDTLASAFIWKNPEIKTCVLRPCNVLGPHVNSLLCDYLSLARVPTVMGFNPMMQLIHEDDITEAIALALDREIQGVFNVAGPGEVPLHTAIQETGGVAWPIPEPILRRLFGRLFRWGMWPYPPGVFDYLKFPLSLAGERFVEATGFHCFHGLSEIFDGVRR